MTNSAEKLEEKLQKFIIDLENIIESGSELLDKLKKEKESYDYHKDWPFDGMI